MRFGVSGGKLLLSFLLLTAALPVMATVSGESNRPKIALLRLEDVGPGGEYGSLEGLGKLRTVLDYLETEGVRFQIGVIPKWVNYSEQGISYNRSIGEPGDSVSAALVEVLKEAEGKGAVIGMHGYTHQAGTVKREDGHQESGIGNEMNVEGLPETATTSFAEERVREGLRLFDAAGLRPLFWETPHYHSAPEQHQVFRSYFGIVHENAPEQPGQTGLYIHPFANKGFGAASWGAAYVPTPYSYIPYNKDERLILDQLGRSDRLPSFFYHAFLEFKDLEPVLDPDGRPVMREGLPEYRYPDKPKTNLQKIVAGFRDREYRFISLTDYVPFVPGPEALPAGGTEAIQLADVTGDGELDAVSWNEGGLVSVRPGRYGGRRNEPQPATAGWASVPKDKSDLYALKDENGDGRADLWIARKSGKLELYRSTGASFRFIRSWKLPGRTSLEEIRLMKRLDGSIVLAGTAEGGSKLVPYWLEDGAWKEGTAFQSRAGAFKSLQAVVNPGTGAEELARCRKDTGICYRLELPPGRSRWSVTRQATGLPLTGGDIRLADFNGDGLEDALLWDQAGRLMTVYRQGRDGRFHELASMGPWGEPGAKLILADFDGDGRTDAAALEPDGRLDTALSLQTADPVK